MVLSGGADCTLTLLSPHHGREEPMLACAQDALETANDGGLPPSPLSRRGARRRPDLPITVLELGEEQNESDDEAEDAETFCERRTDERAGELAVSSRRVAQGARQEVAEDVANAHSGETHANAGKARAEELESNRIHCELLE
jgi:hypothetical protein